MFKMWLTFWQWGTVGDISDFPDLSDDDFDKDMPYIPPPISDKFDDNNNDNNVIRVVVKNQS